MSKIALLIVTLLVLVIPQQAFALESCVNSEITPLSTVFPEGATEINLTFQIKNGTVLNSLMSKKVRANFGYGRFPNEVETPETTITSDKFTLTLRHPNLLNGNGGRPHEGKLEQENTKGGFNPLCSVDYKVGLGKECALSKLPDAVQPNTFLPVAFMGDAKTLYLLCTYFKDTSAGNCWKETITGADGKGEFPPTRIPGSNGDIERLEVKAKNSTSVNAVFCSKKILIDVKASPIDPTAPIAPIVPPIVAPVDPCKNPDSDNKACSKAGGEPCNKDDKENPGFKTAIGCIHTTPKALVEDVLKFATGIGGGLAFMMMLLGAFQMLTSGGNPQNLQGGKDVLQNALIGLLFIIFSILLMKIIGIDILSLPGFN